MKALCLLLLGTVAVLAGSSPIEGDCLEWPGVGRPAGALSAPIEASTCVIDSDWYLGEERVIIAGSGWGNVSLVIRELRDKAFYTGDAAEGFLVPYIIECPRGGMTITFELPPVDFIEDDGWGVRLYLFVGPPRTTSEIIIFNREGELLHLGGMITDYHHDFDLEADDLSRELLVKHTFDDFPEGDPEMLFLALGVITGNRGWPVKEVESLMGSSDLR